MVLPVVAVSFLATINWYAVVPAMLWITFCFGYGVWLAVGEGEPVRSIGFNIGNDNAFGIVEPGSGYNCLAWADEQDVPS